MPRIDLSRRLRGAAAIALLGLSTLAGAARAVELVDDLGRRLDLPAPAQRVYGSAPPFMVLLASLAPERAIGLNFALPPGAAAYAPPGFAALPVLGGVAGHGLLADPEALIVLKPDLVLGWHFSLSNDEETLALGRRTGAPVLMLRLEQLADWPRAYALAGRALGLDERARLLGDYIRDALARVQGAVAGVPPAHRVRVYYAEQPDGLATECDQSFHAEAIALAGGVNVHRCLQSSVQGLERVSLEQVMQYDPDVIVVQEPAFMARLQEDARWRGLRAVREGRVHLVPRLPFNWIDRPPSATRALGIQWLAGLFYPQRFSFDAQQAVPAFYRLFFGIPLDAQQVRALMAASSSASAEAPPQMHHGGMAAPSRP